MADRIVKPDTGNDLVLQNDDASAKIEINEAGTVVATPSIQVDNIKIDGNTISSTDTNGNITLDPNGTADIVVGNGSNPGKITSSGAYNLELYTNAGTDSGYIKIIDGANQNIDIVPNGTGSAYIKKVDIDGGTIDETDVNMTSGTLTTTTAQNNAIVNGATGSTFNGTIGTSASGFGLVTHADQWRLSADVTSEGIITTNFEQVDTDSFSPIGSSMTESSGIFQFPATGTWWIGAVGAMVTSSASQFSGVYIHTNISGVSATRTAVLGNGNGTNYYIGTFSNLIFNVTNTSTHKVSFEFNSSGSSHSRILGDTNINYTHFTFIRLGDN